MQFESEALHHPFCLYIIMAIEKQAKKLKFYSPLLENLPWTVLIDKKFNRLL